jgi:hypothetical protein
MKEAVFSFFFIFTGVLRSRCVSSVPETSSPFQSAAIVGAEKVDTVVSYKK